jgi:hypothetical protein
MAALDPQARIAILERELHSANRELDWANFTIQKRDAQIRLLEERLRQRRIQVLGPHSETLSDLQLELFAASGTSDSLCGYELQKVRPRDGRHRLRRE